jgi:POT family proton-dependent oligopeptide transporter
MTNNLTSQAATMRLGGVPNDIVTNLNPISIIILIPIMDFGVSPLLRKMNIRFTPIKRIATGFFLASMAMVSATVIQFYIYQGPCGSKANTCVDVNGKALTVDISVWVQILPYALVGFSEIMASITSLEYAYTKAPTNMRSTVQAIALLQSAFSSAIAQALVPLAEDSLLVWNYGVVAVLAAVGGVLFWLSNRKLDKEEDALNNLPHSKFVTKEKMSDPESGSERRSVEPAAGVVESGKL